MEMIEFLNAKEGCFRIIFRNFGHLAGLLPETFSQLKSLGRFFVGLEAFQPETNKSHAGHEVGLFTNRFDPAFRVNDKSMISPQSFQLLHPLP